MNFWITLLIGYEIVQSLVSGYFFSNARKISKKSFAGTIQMGKKSKSPLKIFLAGDSLAAGVGALSFESSIPGRIAARLSKGHHFILTNVAVSGSRMKDITALPKQKQDIIIIVASSNDLYHFTNFKSFRKGTIKILDNYTKLAKKIVLVGPGDIGGTIAIPLFLKPLYKLQRPKYAAIMREVSSKYKNVEFANPADFDIRPYGYTHATDGFHPNDSGHKYWAELILSKIE